MAKKNKKRAIQRFSNTWKNSYGSALNIYVVARAWLLACLLGNVHGNNVIVYIRICTLVTIPTRPVKIYAFQYNN